MGKPVHFSGYPRDPKDAYDLFYVLRNFGNGARDVATALRPLLEDEDAQRALDVLRRDFGSIDSIGPRAVAQFLFARPDDAVQAEVVTLVAALLDACSRPVTG